MTVFKSASDEHFFICHSDRSGGIADYQRRFASLHSSVDARIFDYCKQNVKNPQLIYVTAPASVVAVLISRHEEPERQNDQGQVLGRQASASPEGIDQ